jgi:chorismate-pyruvate lyase
MSSSFVPPPRRACFADVPGPHERLLLDLLLAQDGSTTRLCETVAGGPIAVLVLRQAVTVEVPDLVRSHLPGSHFIERITSLVAHGEVMMDNLVYIALDGLEPDIESDLRAGTMPIGHLLARWWVRRAWIASADDMNRRLWQAVGSPDPDATRCHAIVTPEGPRMVLAETFRRGMLINRHAR